MAFAKIIYIPRKKPPCLTRKLVTTGMHLGFFSVALLYLVGGIKALESNSFSENDQEEGIDLESDKVSGPFVHNPFHNPFRHPFHRRRFSRPFERRHFREHGFLDLDDDQCFADAKGDLHCFKTLREIPL